MSDAIPEKLKETTIEVNSEVLTEKEAGEYLRCPAAQVRRLPIPKTFLNPTTRRHVRYRLADLRAFMEQAKETKACPSTSVAPHRFCNTSSMSKASRTARAPARLTAELPRKLNGKPRQRPDLSKFL